MADKVFVVADATSVMGKALALSLVREGRTVVMVARDPDNGNAALNEISMDTPDPKIDLQLCDLSILASVRNLAEILRSRYQTVDVVINNSRVHNRKRTVTIDGFEEMFAANYLGPFLLTTLLLDQLQAAAQANGSAHILNMVAPSTVPLDLDDLQSERNFNASNAFGAVQTANLLFTLELARRLENTGITVNAIQSSLVKEGGGFSGLFTRLTSPSPKKASGSIVEAATAPEFEKITGKLLNEGKEIDIPAYALDTSAQQRLWEISERLSGLSQTKGEMPINDPKLSDQV